MEIGYTSRNIFGPDYQDGTSWVKYRETNNPFHIKELITLDAMLGEPNFEPDFEKAETYDVDVTSDNLFFTYCYRDLNYVLSNVKKGPFTNCSQFHSIQKITAIKRRQKILNLSDMI
jgi:hypothetical protein